MNTKFVRESIAVKASIVLPPDTNHHGTMFGGKVMAYIDDLAAISATRHARMPVVTASTDSVDFLHPVRNGESVCLESFVTWTHKTSLEVFVKVVAEDLLQRRAQRVHHRLSHLRRRGRGGKPATRSSHHSPDRARALPPRGRPGPGGDPPQTAGGVKGSGDKVRSREGVGEGFGGK